MTPQPGSSTEASAVPAGAALLDVREMDEWEAGHVEGALHVPLGLLPERLAELPEGELYVICRSGARSARAVAWLVQNGVDAINVDGGMHAWAAAGRSMVSETGAEPAVR